MTINILEEYEDTLFGIPVVLHNAVCVETSDDGERFTTIPDEDGLVAAMVMVRALNPLKLSSADLKFFRKALGLKAKEFAEALDVDPATVSRWENDAQGVGGYCDKMIRHYVCGEIHKRAPAIDFDPQMITSMRVVGIRTSNEPICVFERVRLKMAETRVKLDAWDTREVAA